MTLPARIDHLVVLASNLEQGAEWCRAMLGVEPGPGGEHPLMGTHNRLLRVSTVDRPRAYVEVIAIQPGKTAQGGRRRWFDMDDPRVQRSVKEEPRLAHFVANVPDLAAALQAWQRLGIDPGRPIEASRMTPRGLLEWKITVRDDGRRLFDGCLPTLIEWGEAHPTAAMADSGVALETLAVTHPQANELTAAFDAIGLQGVGVSEGEASLCTALLTPKGRIEIESKGL